MYCGETYIKIDIISLCGKWRLIFIGGEVDENLYICAVWKHEIV